MPLGVNEIVAGCVAFLDGDALVADKLVSCSATKGKIGVRPYLCFHAGAGRSSWLEITTKWNAFRIPIRLFVVSGPKSWTTTENYINDARDICEGPDTSFIAASGKDTVSNNRPMISSDGVNLIIEWVNYYIYQAFVGKGKAQSSAVAVAEEEKKQPSTSTNAALSS